MPPCFLYDKIMITYAKLDERIRLLENNERGCTEQEALLLQRDLSQMIKITQKILHAEDLSVRREINMILNALYFDFFQDEQHVFFGQSEDSKKHSRLFSLTKDSVSTKTRERFCMLPDIFDHIVMFTEQDGGSNERMKNELAELLQRWNAQ
jgi:uncharacterized protein (UPF0332 family)